MVPEPEGGEERTPNKTMTGAFAKAFYREKPLFGRGCPSSDHSPVIMVVAPLERFVGPGVRYHIPPVHIDLVVQCRALVGVPF